MESNSKTKILYIEGMTCVNCQNRIEKKLRGISGVKKAAVSYRDGTARITYDKSVISLAGIIPVIEKLEYRVTDESARNATKTGRVIVLLAVIAVLYVLLESFGVLNLLLPSRLADTGMSYGLLFVIGLITSVHCIAMCGGINLSQCIPQAEATGERTSRAAPLVPAFMYNLGRVISYTAVGFILGFAGMLFGGGSDFGVSVLLQGILKLIAGVFMVAMGINMLGLFPALRKLQPRMPKFLARKSPKAAAKNKSPLIVGLLNGLMPCGPLQSIQIVALASANPLTGAVSMLLFSMGTVPLMFGLGSLVSVLGQRFTKKITDIGAVLVAVLGLAMLSQGGSLSGLLPPGLLLQIVIALCAVGIVSKIPFRRPQQKIVSTAAALCLAVLVLTSWQIMNTSSGEKSGSSIVDGKQIVNS
ncbi:MAG TPA: heavy metal transporter, partial [Ruminococcaceae bacterium]|nr:heavy metal transporter [Oscillospiraceae bacterium]